MARKALLVGINNYPYGDDDDLRGCVNDAKGWYQVLKDHYDFAARDMRLLTNSKARRKDIVRELKWLLKRAKTGDVLVFANSSHGTNEKDTDNDEPDGFDEALCPYDTDDNVLLDDDIRELISTVPSGVRLSIISDSCHSGTVTRLRPGRTTSRRRRYLSPEKRGKVGVVNPAARSIQRRKKFPEESMTELLLSGCKPRESSYDDQFGNVFHGALTFYALETLREKNYKVTWKDLHKAVLKKLHANEYDQSPRLEGRAARKARQVFT
jgi:hypothetical protein